MDYDWGASPGLHLVSASIPSLFFLSCLHPSCALGESKFHSTIQLAIDGVELWLILPHRLQMVAELF
jgi:hypothetical protein